MEAAPRHPGPAGIAWCHIVDLNYRRQSDKTFLWEARTFFELVRILLRFPTIWFEAADGLSIQSEVGCSLNVHMLKHAVFCWKCLGLGWEWERLAMGTNLWLQTSKFWVQRTARWLQLQYCMET